MSRKPQRSRRQEDSPLHHEMKKRLRHRKQHRKMLRLGVESLEERLVLSAPTLVNLPTQVNIAGGYALHMSLDGEGAVDANNDGIAELTYTVTSNNPELITYIPEGNDSLRITVSQEHADSSISTYGDIIIELAEDRAPDVTARIKELAELGFYDGLTFHRVIDGFMIQGGDPDGTGGGGSGQDFFDQFHEDLVHSSGGVISMANSGANTNDSQFFITEVATPHLDFLSDDTAGGDHSVFGFITEGDDVREIASNVEVDSNDMPVETLYMDVDVFTDYENGVLMIKAPKGYTGSTSVTVTVTNENGESQSYDIDVEVGDFYSWWPEVPDLTIEAGGTGDVVIPAVNYSGFTLQTPVDHFMSSTDSMVDVDFTFDADTRTISVSAPAASAGLHWITIPAYHATYGTYYQTLSVYVTPAQPEFEVELDSITGGIYNSITANDNTTDHTLRFTARKMAPNSSVELYMDGERIPMSILSDLPQGEGDGTYNVKIQTYPGEAIPDGEHVFTVRQTVAGNTSSSGASAGYTAIESLFSESITLTIDTTAPVVTSQDITDAIELSPYIYNVNTDEESGGNVVYALGSTYPTGMQIDEQTGEITWTPASTQVAVNTVEVLITDGAGNQTTHTFQIDVAPGDFTFSVTGDYTVSENATVVLELLADGDGVIGPVTYSIGDNELPVGAVTTFAMVDGTMTFTWDTTEADGPGSYDVTFIATDSDATFEMKTVTLIIDEVNTAPSIFNYETEVNINEHELAVNLIEATDSDLPANDIIFSLVGDYPDDAAIDSDTGAFTWTPDETFGGSDQSFTVRATDPSGGYDEVSFVVHVTETDTLPPVITAPVSISVDEGGTLQYQITAIDPDDDTDSPGFELVGTVPSGMTIDAATGQISWAVPNELSAADSSFTITVRATEQASDGTDNYSDVTIQINVNEVNVAPVIGDGFYSEVQVNEHLTVENQFTATDSDLPANVIVFSLVGNYPDGAAIDSDTGAFTWTPGETFGGSDQSFTVRATDPSGGYDEVSVYRPCY